METCKETFWQHVFQREADYLIAHLQGAHDILSVGCGPAVIEGKLSAQGFQVTGLDISPEALQCAPDGVRTVTGRAEDMLFSESSFDAVIYVASLQFIENYHQALQRSLRVLRPQGKIIAMLLNPQSEFFKNKRRDPDSYINLIRHTDLQQIENALAENFTISAEYFLGIKEEKIFASHNPIESALYVIVGRKNIAS